MSKKKTEEQALRADEPSFEKAMERLETIVEDMEGGKLSLEDMMARFEEGQGLVKLCSAKLTQVERRIEILVKEGETVTAERFEDEDESGKTPSEKPDDGLPF